MLCNSLFYRKKGPGKPRYGACFTMAGKFLFLGHSVCHNINYFKLFYHRPKYDFAMKFVSGIYTEMVCFLRPLYLYSFTYTKSKSICFG